MSFAFRSPAALPATPRAGLPCPGWPAFMPPVSRAAGGTEPISPPTDSGFSTVGRHRVGSYPCDGNCPWAGIYFHD